MLTIFTIDNVIGKSGTFHEKTFLKGIGAYTYYLHLHIVIALKYTDYRSIKD